MQVDYSCKFTDVDASSGPYAVKLNVPGDDQTLNELINDTLSALCEQQVFNKPVADSPPAPAQLVSSISEKLVQLAVSQEESGEFLERFLSRSLDAQGRTFRRGI